MKLTIEPQPRAFIRLQPPATRRRLREILHALERGGNVPEPLDDELDGFYRVKVEGYRLILQRASGDERPLFRVVFIERRGMVYELFRQIIGLE